MTNYISKYEHCSTLFNILIQPKSPELPLKCIHSNSKKNTSLLPFPPHTPVSIIKNMGKNA